MRFFRVLTAAALVVAPFDLSWAETENVRFHIQNQFLVSGHDSEGFFHPRISHDGKHVAWVNNSGSVFVDMTPETPNDSVKMADFDMDYSKNSPVTWSPNNEYVLFSSGIADTGGFDKRVLSKLSVLTGEVFQEIFTAADLGLDPDVYGVQNPCITPGTTTSWIVFTVLDFTTPALPFSEGVYRMEVSDDGDPIAGTAQKVLGEITMPGGNKLLAVNMQASRSGNEIVFEQPLTQTTRRIWLVPNVNSLVSPITDSSGIIAVTDGTRYATTPNFSHSGTKMYWSQDTAGIFNETAIIATLPGADFDPYVIDTSDVIAGTATPRRIQMDNNQALLSACTGRSFVTYVDLLDPYIGVVMANIKVTDSVLLGANDEFTADYELDDGNGNVIMFAAGDRVIFPASKAQARGAKSSHNSVNLSIETPIAIPDQIDLDPLSQRLTVKLGDPGLQFVDHGHLQITYLDSDVEGLDEATLEVVLVSEDGTHQLATVTARDVDNNTITVEMPHFSWVTVTPNGALEEQPMPLSTPATLMVLATLLIAAGSINIYRVRKHA